MSAMASVISPTGDNASVYSMSTIASSAGGTSTTTASTMTVGTHGTSAPPPGGPSAASQRDPGHYNSSDVDLPIRVRVVAFEGRLPELDVQDILEDAFQRTARQNGSQLFITCQLFADNKPWTLPCRTTYVTTVQDAVWNEWLALPVKLRDLPPTAQLVFTLWHLYSPGRYATVGGTTFRLFTQPKADRPSRLKEGSHKLDLWPNREGDGSTATTTPSKSVATEEAHRRDKLLKLFEEGGNVAHVDWLDRAAMEALQEQSKAVNVERPLVLHIHLPKYDFPVYHHAKRYPVPMPRAASALVLVQDPEALRESPIEIKHVRLARGHRSSPVDRDLKPNPTVRNQLNAIIAYPPTRQLSLEEKDLVWRFRFYLTREKKALTKFLKAVVWEEATEERQALELLDLWAPIDMDDALELLTPAFNNTAVRAYAVSRLRTVEDEELQLYLLQLVQALKFEGIAERPSADSALATFLIQRATANVTLGNYLLWFLIVESEDDNWSKMFAKVNARLMDEIVSHPNGQQRHDTLTWQRELLKRLGHIYVELGTLNRLKKIERMRVIIADPQNGLTRLKHVVPLPLDPTVRVTGIVAETAYMFKSAKLPLLLAFHAESGPDYKIVFKQGDDVRQDQLVINIIQLMDRLLKKEKLDLQLTSYKVLATGSSQGMIEFVQAEPLAKILEENNNDLQAFLRKHNRDDSAEYQIAPAVMDTYIKSCAGFCVITYLLGIGDRHLDNLLLSTDGKLIHIDFGYILGNDPKLFPPPMKLCPEMVECMGGVDSVEARKFRSLCYLAFNILRKSANLILNLFSLMVHSNVSDIRADPDKAVLKVQENFQLHRTDEEAIQYFRDLINTSMTAMFPQMFETMHKWAQYMRK